MIFVLHLGIGRCKSTGRRIIYSQNGELPDESSILSDPECQSADLKACFVVFDGRPNGFNDSGKRRSIMPRLSA